ncbi:MAG TPA: response regulator transcription factor [Rhodocyclaceae bacterium]|nr:response regulator transcription factor [Rhodocyclaceae bacterium]
MMVRIALADDHRMFREALKAMLETDPDVAVVIEAESGAELLDAVVHKAVDVACVDIAMPDMNGVEATRRLRELCPALKVVGLSAYSDRHFVLELLDAGASAYVTKTEGSDELLRAIRNVRAGRTYLSPDVAATVTDVLRDRSPTAGGRPLLSARERQVLALISEGLTSPEIGERLHLASSTVEVHRRNIMRKLDLHSVAELTKYAIRIGLTVA